MGLLGWGPFRRTQSALVRLKPDTTESHHRLRERGDP